MFSITGLIKELRAEIDSLRARNDILESEVKKRDRNISLPSSTVRVGEPQPGLYCRYFNSTVTLLVLTPGPVVIVKYV